MFYFNMDWLHYKIDCLIIHLMVEPTVSKVKFEKSRIARAFILVGWVFNRCIPMWISPTWNSINMHLPNNVSWECPILIRLVFGVVTSFFLILKKCYFSAQARYPRHIYRRDGKHVFLRHLYKHVLSTRLIDSKSFACLILEKF